MRYHEKIDFMSMSRTFSRRTVLTESPFSNPGLWTPEIQEKVFFFSLPLATVSKSTLEELLGCYHSPTRHRGNLFLYQDKEQKTFLEDFRKGFPTPRLDRGKGEECKAELLWGKKDLIPKQLIWLNPTDLSYKQWNSFKTAYG